MLARPHPRICASAVPERAFRRRGRPGRGVGQEQRYGPELDRMERLMKALVDAERVGTLALSSMVCMSLAGLTERGGLIHRITAPPLGATAQSGRCRQGASA